MVQIERRICVRIRAQERWGDLGRKRFTAERIINHLRGAETQPSKGQTVVTVCCQPGVGEQTQYCWRMAYGGMKVSQARRLEDLEQENSRLKKAAADLGRDRPILEVSRPGK